VLVEPGPHRIEFRNLNDQVVDQGRATFRAEAVYTVSKLRDQLNGGRHFLSVGYAHTWFGGAQWKTDAAPSAPGFRVGYDFRFPSRVPLIRRLGLFADFAAGFFPQVAAEGGLTAPRTTHLELGVGLRFRLDLGPVVLQVGPRVAVMTLLRADYGFPFVHWLLGGAGGDFAVGVRPVRWLTIQVRYQPTFVAADLHLVTARDEPAPLWMAHRLVGGVEFGF